MEIKPQDLRVGNKLNCVDGYIGTVSEIKHGRCMLVKEQRGTTLIEYSFGYDELSGIELTPEWLEKLGFQDCNDPEFDSWAAAKMYFKGMIQVGAFRTDQNETVKYTSYLVKHPTFLNGNPINHINTVHQLQNLYFAVHGEELAIDKTSLKN